MINYVLATILLLVGVFYFFRKEGLNKGDSWSLVLSIAWSFLFFSYGSAYLSSVWAGANAADFFVIFTLVFWGGTALFASIPAIRLEDWKRVKKLFMLFIGIGIIYIAVDNISLGPSAVGPSSPYKGMDLCKLDATYYAEDVFAGCYLVQKFGVSPFGVEANFIVYVLYSLGLLLLGIYLVGVKKLEDLIGG